MFTEGKTKWSALAFTASLLYQLSASPVTGKLQIKTRGTVCSHAKHELVLLANVGFAMSMPRLTRLQRQCFQRIIFRPSKLETKHNHIDYTKQH